MREKRGKDPKQRLEELLNCKVSKYLGQNDFERFKK